MCAAEPLLLASLQRKIPQKLQEGEASGPELRAGRRRILKPVLTCEAPNHPNQRADERTSKRTISATEILWMVEIEIHVAPQNETIDSRQPFSLVLAVEASCQGFLGGAKWISSIHSSTRFKYRLKPVAKKSPQPRSSQSTHFMLSGLSVFRSPAKTATKP